MICKRLAGGEISLPIVFLYPYAAGVAWGSNESVGADDVGIFFFKASGFGMVPFQSHDESVFEVEKLRQSLSVMMNGRDCTSELRKRNLATGKHSDLDALLYCLIFALLILLMHTDRFISLGSV